MPPTTSPDQQPVSAVKAPVTRSLEESHDFSSIDDRKSTDPKAREEEEEKKVAARWRKI